MFANWITEIKKCIPAHDTNIHSITTEKFYTIHNMDIHGMNPDQ
jgi:hypothetical protein